MITDGAVRAALAQVRDPELDEAITELGFVESVRVDGEAVAVRLRLPTFFCAPNFAYLMVADAREALEALPGAGRVDIDLVDHFAGEEISEGVGRGAGFASTFDGLADGELDELRLVFLRKSFLARTATVCERLQVEGADAAELARMRLVDLPPGDEAREYLDKRRALGFDMHPQAPLLVDVEGAPVSPEAAAVHLRRCRTVRVSIEGNAGFCRGLLHTRYADTGGMPDHGPRRPAALGSSVTAIERRKR